MTVPRHCPDDILVEILAHLCECEVDKRTSLQNITLVSKQCTRLAQPLLFESITICDDIQGLVFCKRVMNSPYLFERTTLLKLVNQRPCDESGRVIEGTPGIFGWLRSTIAHDTLRALPTFSMLELDGFIIEDLRQFEESMRFIAVNATITTLRLAGGSVKCMNTLSNLIQIFPALGNVEIIGIRMESHAGRIGDRNPSITTSDSIVAQRPLLRSFLVHGTTDLCTLFSAPVIVCFLTQIRTLDVTIACTNDARKLANLLTRTLATLSHLFLRSAVPSSFSQREIHSDWPNIPTTATSNVPMSLVSFSDIRSRDAHWVSKLLAVLLPASKERHVSTLELNLHVHLSLETKPDVWAAIDDVAVRAVIVISSVEVTPGVGVDTSTGFNLARSILPRCSSLEGFSMEIHLSGCCGSDTDSVGETLEEEENAGKWAQFVETMTMEFNSAQLCNIDYEY